MHRPEPEDVARSQQGEQHAGCQRGVDGEAPQLVEARAGRQERRNVARREQGRDADRGPEVADLRGEASSAMISRTAGTNSAAALRFAYEVEAQPEQGAHERHESRGGECRHDRRSHRRRVTEAHLTIMGLQAACAEDRRGGTERAAAPAWRLDGAWISRPATTAVIAAAAAAAAGAFATKIGCLTSASETAGWATTTRAARCSVRQRPASLAAQRGVAAVREQAAAAGGAGCRKVNASSSAVAASASHATRGAATALPVRRGGRGAAGDSLAAPTGSAASWRCEEQPGGVRGAIDKRGAAATAEAALAALATDDDVERLPGCDREVRNEVGAFAADAAASAALGARGVDSHRDDACGNGEVLEGARARERERRLRGGAGGRSWLGRDRHRGQCQHRREHPGEGPCVPERCHGL